jgi:hypothetical protein
MTKIFQAANARSLRGEYLALTSTKSIRSINCGVDFQDRLQWNAPQKLVNEL